MLKFSYFVSITLEYIISNYIDLKSKNWSHVVSIGPEYKNVKPKESLGN